ncbi:hypothetical protein M011DRAFT_779 [Sporormia fimetaria CBS 119925]|uniref:Uncharacterized protein n=1 Tax=Sporormia fimetaria CBS 119925 TaxID=1340428 RepID=A0A6A6VM23_9PLEO|nr:hypothetical protein M011DRAFT_779 [Sporormia fimetaria CBS 119925]
MAELLGVGAESSVPSVFTPPPPPTSDIRHPTTRPSVGYASDNYRNSLVCCTPIHTCVSVNVVTSIWSGRLYNRLLVAPSHVDELRTAMCHRVPLHIFEKKEEKKKERKKRGGQRIIPALYIATNVWYCNACRSDTYVDASVIWDRDKLGWTFQCQGRSIRLCGNAYGPMFLC